MKIQHIIDFFEDLAPLQYAEGFDNVGLIVGDRHATVKSILVSHDTLEEVVDEAIEKKCNLIVSFHPIVFTGLKKITGNSYVERVIIKAIKNDIAIYAIHTALDNARNGVNAILCGKLGLVNPTILIPKKETIKKLITFVPHANAEKLRDALFEAGAGNIGNYDNCSFNVKGTGTFRANENANPTIGKKGETHFEEETQIGITYPAHLEKHILNALFKNHPYEEVAHEITTLENTNQNIGMGMIAELPEALDELAFLASVKNTLQVGCIRHSSLLHKKIKKVAVLGGSGSFAIEAAKHAGADAFLTGDLKYHDFYKAERQVLIADIGHYESEQFTKFELVEFLTKKITNFAPAFKEGKVIISEVNTNPIKYL